MGFWALAVLALSVIASCIAISIKARWRVPKPHTYEWGPLPEVWQIRDIDDFANSLMSQSPLNKLPFTPTLSCEHTVSPLLDRYDWQVRPESAYNSRAGCGFMELMPWVTIIKKEDPRTVWAVPHGMDRLLELADRHCDPSHNNRTVHFAGTEQPLEHSFGATPNQRRATVARLRKYFNRIVYQSKDWPIEGVHLAPMGLSWGYMYALFFEMKDHLSPRLYARKFLNRVANASEVTLAHKTKGILATKSRVASWLDAEYTLIRAGRQLERDPPNLILSTKTYSSPRSIYHAYMSRKDLREWAVSSEAAEAGVDFRSLPVPEWWIELPKYRFLLNPMGSAVQTAKTYEALLALTVPIVLTRGYSAFSDLVRMGFPLVLIRNWTEVTRENADLWWQKTSPRLESFRRNCLTVDGYWGLITGRLAVCE